jgi:hypothetical protein
VRSRRGCASPSSSSSAATRPCGPSCRSGLTAQNRHRDDLIEPVGTESAEGKCGNGATSKHDSQAELIVSTVEEVARWVDAFLPPSGCWFS